VPAARPHPPRAATPGPNPPATETPETVNLKALERHAIERALVATGGHRARASELLGISERTLRNKLNGPAGDHE
jgi:DNA-binding NtrC family response regulator